MSLELLALIPNDPENLLYEWAKATLDENQKDLSIAGELKKQAVEIGATEEDFNNALNAMRILSELFKDEE
ncbi:MAG TPA: hypothetical protein VKC54_00900 [Patescibacteria group bacterium]|nr:hypothetical protein [Patescibacteria group bacterium]